MRENLNANDQVNQCCRNESTSVVSETDEGNSGSTLCSPPATLPRKYLRDFPSDVQKSILAEIKRKHGEVKNGEYEFDIESLVVNFSPSESLQLYDPDYQLLKIRD